MFQIWQLFSSHGVWWRAGQPWTLGHCRTRRLRQAETAFISSDWCFSHLFLCGVTVLIWKCHFQMVPRDQTSLCRCTDFTHRWVNDSSFFSYCEVLLRGVYYGYALSNAYLQSMTCDVRACDAFLGVLSAIAIFASFTSNM